jgi:REP element-mobilizing transposase RayT
MMQERKKNRLAGYEYSRPGAYFVTLCAQNRESWFGKIFKGAGLQAAYVELNQYGEMLRECWAELPEHYPNCQLDEFVVMPNHMHGIIIIVDSVGNGLNVGNGLKPFPIINEMKRCHGLPEIIRGFKTFSSRRIHCECRESFDCRERPECRERFETVPYDEKFRWQKSYYDRVIRHDGELKRIREYMRDNPIHWEIDQENPARQMKLLDASGMI